MITYLQQTVAPLAAPEYVRNFALLGIVLLTFTYFAVRSCLAGIQRSRLDTWATYAILASAVIAAVIVLPIYVISRIAYAN